MALLRALLAREPLRAPVSDGQGRRRSVPASGMGRRRPGRGPAAFGSSGRGGPGPAQGARVPYDPSAGAPPVKQNSRGHTSSLKPDSRPAPLTAATAGTKATAHGPDHPCRRASFVVLKPARQQPTQLPGPGFGSGPALRVVARHPGALAFRAPGTGLGPEAPPPLARARHREDRRRATPVPAWAPARRLGHGYLGPPSYDRPGPLPPLNQNNKIIVPPGPLGNRINFSWNYSAPLRPFFLSSQNNLDRRGSKVE